MLSTEQLRTHGKHKRSAQSSISIGVYDHRELYLGDVIVRRVDSLVKARWLLLRKRKALVRDI